MDPIFKMESGVSGHLGQTASTAYPMEAMGKSSGHEAVQLQIVEEGHARVVQHKQLLAIATVQEVNGLLLMTSPDFKYLLTERHQSLARFTIQRLQIDDFNHSCKEHAVIIRGIKYTIQVSLVLWKR